MCLEDRPLLEPNAGGIDIGAREIFVAVPPDRDENPVRVFSTFTEDLEAMARWLVEKDGIFIGSSSAVNCKFRNFYTVTKHSFLPQGVAAVQTALTLSPGQCVVTVLCDSGTRHLSKFWAQVGDIGGTAGTKIQDFLPSFPREK